MRALYPLALTLAIFGSAAGAQQSDDRDYLTALLEDNLSGAGRQVTITGFRGALSSVASIDSLTIADDQGIWLSLEGVALDWSRAALLRGEISVNALTAKEIVLDRIPLTPQSTLPSPEAGQFQLPELPVSIDIGRLAADRIVIGKAVMGQTIEAELDAALSLIDGEGVIDLTLQRKDSGPDGLLALDARYSNADQRLSIDLNAQEGAGGVATTLLGLPKAPAVGLKISGNGPFSDFLADVSLTTDNTPRLTGNVQLLGKQGDATTFTANLGGDLAPLFVPEYAAFFGNRIDLNLNGARWPDGRIDLDRLSINAAAISLNGNASLLADGLPIEVKLNGNIRHPEGKPVLLPLTSELPVRVGGVDLMVQYDGRENAGWTADFQITDFDRADFRAKTLALRGTGRIGRDNSFNASVGVDAAGLAPTGPALAQALGDQIEGAFDLNWRQGDQGLSISNLALQGADFQLMGQGAVEGLDTALQASGDVTATFDDLARLSGLAGRPLSGAATITTTGKVAALTGAFDVVANVSSRDLGLSVDQIDRALKGETTLVTSVARTTAGTELRSFSLRGTAFSADAKGRIATDGSEVDATFDATDLSVLGAGYKGSAKGSARLSGTLSTGEMTVKAQATSLAVGQKEADTLLRGNSVLDLIFDLQDGAVVMRSARIDNPQVQATALGSPSAAGQSFGLKARLANLAVLLPEFPGSLTVSGRAIRQADSLALDVNAAGPGGIDAAAKGVISLETGQANLTLNGRAQAALANAFISPRSLSGATAFDLRLVGPIALTNLTGNARISGGRLADPNLGFALKDIAGTATLRGSLADVRLTSNVTSGGAIEAGGTVGLSAPYSSDIGIKLKSVTLRDPNLYQSTLTGELSLRGPITGGAQIAGRIALSDTELRVPSTGFGSDGGLPGLKHKNEPAPVRETRARADQQNSEGAASNSGRGQGYGLDIVVSAPKRLFIRGRGLDAELGGELRLLGTTTNVSPSGSFTLFRGRLNLLGKRLDLTEAVLQMQGELVPFVRIVADTQTDTAVVGIVIEGPATNPVVAFTSSPELPEEEVLAQLLFGQNLQTLSPLQALQMANAVATLAGRGGEGIVGRLRRGFGLDNLDVKTDADGTASLTAGKYLTEKVYSEVTVDQVGKSQINLNLDISNDIKLRARTGSDGESGVGVFLEKDY
ncbi:MAG: translocation/assembly module TamB domain-containing protein [Microgenomates group bacterium]